MGVYTSNGATYALTPGGAGAGGTANLLTLPNTGNMVGVVTVAQVTKTPITTSLKDAFGSAAMISGTSLDPANDVGMAFNYYIGKISLFKLSTATEITTFDTLTIKTMSYSGAGGVKIAGAIMNPLNKTIILATADGFEVVDYSNPAAPVKVREIPSLAVNATSGVEIMENFAFDAALTKGAMIITGGGSTYTGGATGTAGPLMSLVDANTGSVYRPDTVTAALFVKSDYIDAAAVDTTYHVAILADEGIGTTFVDLNQLTLNASAGTYSLPAAAVSRITTYTKKDNLAIESTNHLVMMGAGYGGTTLVAAQLKAPSVGLGFAKEIVVTMPGDVDDLGATVSWRGSYDPHGVGAYITPADHPTTPNTSMSIWLSGDMAHIAVINLLGVLNGTLAGGTYNPTMTTPKDIAYFKIPSGSVGGGNTGGGGGVSGTAAQYFTKKAVGNTWTMLQTSTYTPVGQPTSTTTTTEVRTITASTGGVVTYSRTYTSNGFTSPALTRKYQLDTTGAVVSTDGTNTYLDLPATFSVGTTWVLLPADPATGWSAINRTIAAFNVTRTVPAGTFTDCLQINATGSYTSGGVTTTENFTTYVSPSAGYAVEETSSFSSTNSTGTFTSQLQPGYVANP